MGKTRLTLEFLTPLFLFGLLAACEDTGIGVQNNGNNSNNGNSNGNSNTNSNSNGNSNTTGECAAAADCTIALKYDECCACPRPASRKDMAQDPCLLPVGTQNVPDECMVDCPEMPCPMCPNAGKTATCRNGTCDWFEGRCTTDDDCVLGIRTDNCCTNPLAVNRSDIEQDECLVSWPMPPEPYKQSCLDKWDPVCATIDCAPGEPQYRAVSCVTEQDGSWCRFQPECDTKDDCILLVDTRQCCPCPEPWPASMQGRDPCLVPPGQAAPAECLPKVCPAMPCEQCPDVSPECQEHQCVNITWDATLIAPPRTRP